jgi:Holliday junction DNA helicase RuvA
MITYLKGKLVEALPTNIVVDVNGVGYELLIPLSSYQKLPPPGNEIIIYTHLSIREDAHVLYGFMTIEERELFKLLINAVSGVGPKIALNILSGINISNFKSAVASADIKILSQISGVGKKTAERIVVELKDKIGFSSEWAERALEKGMEPANQIANDAVRALVALGYKQNVAMAAVKEAQSKLGLLADLESIVRYALKHAG